MNPESRNFEIPPIDNREKEQKPRLAEIKEKEGKIDISSTRFEYDVAGRVSLKERTYPRVEGKLSQIFGYDGKGRLTSVNTYIEHKADRHASEPVRHEGILEKIYDGDSDRVLMEQYGRDGSTMGMMQYEYDGEGRKILEKKIGFGWNGASETTSSYKYDKNGRMIEKTVEGPDFGAPVKYDYEYDESGRLTKENRGFVGGEKPFGSMVTSYSDDGLTETVVNVYSGKKLWTNETTRDKNGNPVKFKSRNHENKNSKEVVYENTYK